MDVLRQTEPAAKPISESYSDATDKERTARQWEVPRDGRGINGRGSSWKTICTFLINGWQLGKKQTKGKKYIFIFFREKTQSSSIIS